MHCAPPRRRGASIVREPPTSPTCQTRAPHRVLDCTCTYCMYIRICMSLFALDFPAIHFESRFFFFFSSFYVSLPVFPVFILQARAEAQLLQNCLAGRRAGTIRGNQTARTGGALSNQMTQLGLATCLSRLAIPSTLCHSDRLQPANLILSRASISSLLSSPSSRLAIYPSSPLLPSSSSVKKLRVAEPGCSRLQSWFHST